MGLLPMTNTVGEFVVRTHPPRVPRSSFQTLTRSSMRNRSAIVKTGPGNNFLIATIRKLSPGGSNRNAECDHFYGPPGNIEADS